MCYVGLEQAFLKCVLWDVMCFIWEGKKDIVKMFGDC